VKYDNNEEIKIRTESHKKKFLVDIDEEIADIMVERPASIEDPKVNLVIII
jgi:spermidine synthase